MVKNYLLKVSVLLLITLFITVACTNDETNDFIENHSAILQNKTANVRTRSISYQTWEEVERRLDELNAKYDVKWMLNYEQPVEAFDEEYFNFLEKLTRDELGLDTIITSSENLIDDVIINEIDVASTGETELEGGDNADNDIDYYIGDGFARCGFYIEYFSGNSFKTPFLLYNFEVDYTFEYFPNAPDSLSFKSFTDLTGYGSDNVKNEYKDLYYSEYQSLEKQYKVSFVNNSLKLNDRQIVFKSNSINKQNPQDNDFAFNYSYEVSIESKTIIISGAHPGGVKNWRVK